MPLVDLNLDLGQRAHERVELFSVATVVSIACGGHAGDTASMARAVSSAMARGVTIAALAAYPEGGGRVAIGASALAAAVEQQCAALQKIAKKLGFPAAIVKLHGALHDDAATSPAIARAVLDGAARGLDVRDLVVVGPPKGALFDEARVRKVRCAREGFADRVHGATDAIVPRSAATARITDPAAVVRQAIALAASGSVEMICVDTDTPAAVQIAGDVREALLQSGYLAHHL